MPEKSEVNEARGALAVVDKAVFRAAIDLMQSNSLMDKFDKYLEDQGHYQIILDVTFANHLKRFLVQNLSREPVARMIILSDCNGGGGMRGPSPTGLRG